MLFALLSFCHTLFSFSFSFIKLASQCLSCIVWLVTYKQILSKETPDRILSQIYKTQFNIWPFYTSALKQCPSLSGWLYLTFCSSLCISARLFISKLQRSKTPIQTRSLKKNFQIYRQVVRKFALNFSLT